jgi:hypothetical protein
MFTDRAYSRGWVASPDRRTSLLYFAATVPTVGFVHGTADLSPLNVATKASSQSAHRESIRRNPPSSCGTSRT